MAKEKKTKAMLEAELANTRELNTKLIAEANEFQQDLGEMLEYNKNYGSYSRIPFANALTSIKAMKERLEMAEEFTRQTKYGRAEGEKVFCYEKESELNRLWYMVRVALKDPTLKPIDYADVDTGNGQPFNNYNRHDRMGGADGFCDKRG